MAELNKDQLAELGKKFLERQAKDQLRTKAVSNALAKLRDAHKGEYEKYFAEAKKALGL